VIRVDGRSSQAATSIFTNCWPGVRRIRHGVDTHADDPAVLIYTSGTTGQPKGALIPHRALIGNLSGFVCSQNWFGFDPHARRGLRRGVLVAGGLGLDRWPDGRAVAHAVFRPAHRRLERPLRAADGVRADGAPRVTHSFLFPTALKAMMKAYPEPRSSTTWRCRPS
jgi:acetyl-CoA synthetase